jgi:hypothetical protein
MSIAAVVAFVITAVFAAGITGSVTYSEAMKNECSAGDTTAATLLAILAGITVDAMMWTGAAWTSGKGGGGSQVATAVLLIATIALGIAAGDRASRRPGPPGSARDV